MSRTGITRFDAETTEPLTSNGRRGAERSLFIGMGISTSEAAHDAQLSPTILYVKP